MKIWAIVVQDTTNCCRFPSVHLNWNSMAQLLSNNNVSGRQLLSLMAALLWCTDQTLRAADRPFGSTRAGMDVFERRIRPVLIDQCYPCHSADAKKAEGGLRLDSAEDLLKGGDHGAVVIPFEPGKSRLIEMIRRRHPEGRTPRQRGPSRSTIADFESWIRLGAPDPRSQPRPEHAQDRVQKHWAFQPITHPPVPAVRQQSWVQNPIDNFILARLEQSGLRPADAADRAIWLRRASFDLIGLPPTPEEIDTFLADESPRAYANAVDRLLNSLHFGEHWAREWLGWVVHADFDRPETSAVYENAWRYRDYVIAAFNADKPYDQFIREQLAGDLLPDGNPGANSERLIATGFLMAGSRLGPEPHPTKLLLDVADNQIDLTTRTFLGLTVACARCHDHKSDPISMREYYALAGIFTSTSSLADGADGPRRGPPRWLEISLATPEQLNEVTEFEARLAELKEELREAREMRIAFPGEIDSASLAGVVVDNLAAEIHGSWKESNYSTNFVDRNYLHDGDADKGRKSARFVPDLPKEGLYEVLVSYTPRANRATNVPVTITSKDGVKTLRFNQTLPPTVDKVFAPLGRFTFAAGDRGSVVIANEGTKGFVVVDAVRFIPIEAGRISPAVRPADETELKTALLNYRQLEKEFLEFRSNQPVLPKAMSVQEGKIRDCRIRIRGDAERQGDPVPRGFLNVLGTPDSTLYVITDESSGRLELAHWIANPENPLTARVAVNRVWQHFFGQGLVPTLDDFGVLGDRPSHPELLDHLARNFMEQGWSLKKLIRTIMLSSTYQMRSDATQFVAEKDPHNRLLSHMNRRQLPPEVLRDTLLMLSRELDRSIGGSWMPTNNIGAGPVQASRRVQGTSPRRSIYLPVIREQPAEILRLLRFDNADTVLPSAKSAAQTRQRASTVKERFLSERAWGWSDALLRAPVTDDLERMGMAYREAFGRLPSTAENARAKELLRGAESSPAGATQQAQARAAAWEAICRTLFNNPQFWMVD